MTVSKECESEILRLVQAEKWPEGTVAAELGVHHDVVTRVLAQDATGQPAREPRPSKLDAYKGFILEQLERYPRLRATRLRTMIAERGFRGSANSNSDGPTFDSARWRICPSFLSAIIASSCSANGTGACFPM